MHQIISGETHNKKFKIEDFKFQELFDKEKSKFLKILDNKVLYFNKKIISDPVLNYINQGCYDSDQINQFKMILKKEFDDSEKIYPYCGDLFIESFFLGKNKKNKKIYFNKENIKNFEKTINNSIVREIFNVLIKNANLNYDILIQKNDNVKDITIEKNNNISFKLEFDKDFYHQKIILTDYNLLIVDGYIQSVSEIHHLLYNANNDKEDYLIFCYGVSEEVKGTIIKNNNLRKFRVFPICLKRNEQNLNILNDIALIHNTTDIVSVNSGITIYSMIKNTLPKGKKCIISNNNFIIDKTCPDSKILEHKNFLKKRLLEAKNKENKKLIFSRINNLSSKSIKIFLPGDLSKNNDFVRNLDYIMRFLKNITKPMVRVKIENNFKYIPLKVLNFIYYKNVKTKETMKKINKVLLF